MSVTFLESVTPLLDPTETDAVYRHLIDQTPEAHIAFAGLGDIIEEPKDVFRLEDSELNGRVDWIAIKFGSEFLILARFKEVFLFTETFDPGSESGPRAMVH